MTFEITLLQFFMVMIGSYLAGYIVRIWTELSDEWGGRGRMRDKKQSYIRVRMTKREKKIIQLMADAYNMSISHYVRDLVYKDYIKNVGGSTNGK